MRIKNTTKNYGSIAKWFHWVTAALFLAAYTSVYYRGWFTSEETPENWTILQLHLSVGISLGVLVLLRVIWRLMNSNPQPEPGTKLEHLSARIGHISLYFIMILMPITGYLGTSVDTDFFFLFDITKFENTSLYKLIIEEGLNLTFKTFEEPMDFIHKNILGEWLA